MCIFYTFLKVFIYYAIKKYEIRQIDIYNTENIFRKFLFHFTW